METQAAREIKFTRVFCGAMLFPTIATIFGKFIFRNVQGNFRRSLLVIKSENIFMFLTSTFVGWINFCGSQGNA